jgi:ABC-type uncharacterized transport system permease subunit
MPLFWAAVGLYGLAAVLYFVYLGSAGDREAPAARWALLAGFLVHMTEIGMRGVDGVHPVSSVRELVGFISWLMVGAFLLAGIRRRLDAVGAFVAPAAIVLLCAARIVPGTDRPGAAIDALGRIHISLAAAGVSIFALATALAILYLAEERQLKRRRVGQMVKKGMALETLDTLAHRCVQIGFPIFTVAMVTGAMWSARLSETIRPEYTIAVVAWLAFAGLLVARMTAGWRGRRAALITILGFVSALSVLGVYLARAVVG